MSQEIHYNGTWQESIIKSMTVAIRERFPALRKLTFSCEKQHMPLTEEMVIIAKNRLYQGKSGISIMIDYLD